MTVTIFVYIEKIKFHNIVFSKEQKIVRLEYLENKEPSVEETMKK